MKSLSNFFVLAICCLSIQVQGANPGLEWRTHETDHFLIHYPSDLSQHAVKVADYAEKSHASLSEFFQWQPKSKTHVVLIDDFDQSNGYAQPMPNNAMTLFMQPPTSGELLVYDEWLKMLIHHEYTHILHMDKVLGFPSLLRKIFGRIFFTFPNALHPNWFAEGLATYQETDTENRIGRGQSDVFDIMMRSELVSGLKPLSRINTISAHDWPLNTAYLYGVYFFKFIHDVYGEAAIKGLVNNYSDNIIPYQVGSNSISVTGKDLEALWLEFDRYLRGYFLPQNQRIQAKKESRFEVISNDKAFYGLLAKQGGDAVWYSALDRQLGAGLYRHQQGVESRVLNLNSLAEIDVSKQGKVLVSQLEFCDQYSQYYDLYVLGHDDSLQRITQCGRYRQAKWIDEDKILALRYDSAKPVLDVLSADGVLINTFWRGQAGVVMSGLDVDLLGDTLKVVAAIKFQRQEWNLYEFNEGGWAALTETQSLQTNPSIQGEAVVYTQMQIGQSEAYSLTAAGNHNRLTHTYTGISQLVPINESSAWALRYAASGYEVVKIETSNYPVLYEKPYDLEISAVDTEDRDIFDEIESQPYSPLHSLLPSSWFPVYQSDENTKQVGFFTSGADALNIQMYTFQLAHESVTDKWLVNSNYIYNNQFFMALQQGVDYKIDTSFGALYQKTSQWLVGVMKPYLTVDRQVYPFLAVTQSEDYVFNGANTQLKSGFNNDNWLALGVIYDQFKATHWSGGAASGFQLKGSIETTDLVENNLEQSTVFNFDGRLYTPLFNDHTLAQRLFFALDLDGGSNFQLGGNKSDVYIGPGIQVNQRRYALRGYSSDSAKLNGENILLHSLEYRLPIDWRDTTLMAPPVGFNGWSMRGFVDTGSAWDDKLSDALFYTGVGAEVILDVSLGYYFGLRVRIGAAKGFGSESDDSVYMELGGAF